MFWAVVIVFAILVTFGIAVVADYFRGSRQPEPASADAPMTLPRPDTQPEPDELLAQTDSWIWR
jgi:hypothetical protein